MTSARSQAVNQSTTSQRSAAVNQSQASAVSIPIKNANKALLTCCYFIDFRDKCKRRQRLKLIVNALNRQELCSAKKSSKRRPLTNRWLVNASLLTPSALRIPSSLPESLQPRQLQPLMHHPSSRRSRRVVAKVGPHQANLSSELRQIVKPWLLYGTER